MSTRAYIRITKEGAEPIHFHHHCDGYPQGVGAYLVKILKDYKDAWEPKKLGEFINNEDDDFEFIKIGPSWDHEYIYLIDCDKKKLSCFYKGISSSSDDRETMMEDKGDEIVIKDNPFTGEQNRLAIVTQRVTYQLGENEFDTRTESLVIGLDEPIEKIKEFANRKTNAYCWGHLEIGFRDE